jgi:hypothetical protein
MWPCFYSTPKKSRVRNIELKKWYIEAFVFGATIQSIHLQNMGVTLLFEDISYTVIDINQCRNMTSPMHPVFWSWANIGVALVYYCVSSTGWGPQCECWFRFTPWILCSLFAYHKPKFLDLLAPTERYHKSAINPMNFHFFLSFS